MKKLITLGAAAALVFTMGTVVFGADINMTGENQGIPCEYADTNGDGICDTCNQRCTEYADENQDGVCDNCLNKETDGEAHHNPSGHNTCKRSGTSAGTHHSFGTHHSSGHGHGSQATAACCRYAAKIR